VAGPWLEQNLMFTVLKAFTVLPGTKPVFYMHAGGPTHLFFRYSREERGVVEILAKSTKLDEKHVNDILKRNYE